MVKQLLYYYNGVFVNLNDLKYDDNVLDSKFDETQKFLNYFSEDYLDLLEELLKLNEFIEEKRNKDDIKKKNFIEKCMKKIKSKIIRNKIAKDIKSINHLYVKYKVCEYHNELLYHDIAYNYLMVENDNKHNDFDEYLLFRQKSIPIINKKYNDALFFQKKKERKIKKKRR